MKTEYMESLCLSFIWSQTYKWLPFEFSVSEYGCYYQLTLENANFSVILTDIELKFGVLVAESEAQ